MFRRSAKTLALASAGALVLGAVSLSGCTPVTKYSGYQAIDAKPSSAKVGEDTQTTIRTQFGTPTVTSSFESNIWYYISETSDQFGAYRPKVREREVVAITFDKATEKVASVDTLSINDGRVIAFNGRETPTVGRELSVLEQLLGTVGASMGNLEQIDPGQMGR